MKLIYLLDDSTDMFTSAVVLAAGSSRRMKGGGIKVLRTIGEETVLSRLMKTLTESDIDEIILVTGYEADRVREEVTEKILPQLKDSHKRLTVVFNPYYEDGMAVSFREGVKELSPSCDAFLCVLGDQPFVKNGTINILITTYERIIREGSGHLLIHPRWEGKKGHPVLFSPELIPEILELGREDQVRYVTRKHRARAFLLDVEDPGIGLDIDTEEDLERIRNNRDL